MLKLFLRKLLLLIILLPLLNMAGFYYALAHPRVIDEEGDTINRAALYQEYVSGLMQGDLGRAGNTDVALLVVEPLKNSLVLMGIALLIIITLGPLLGLLSISRKTKRVKPRAIFALTAGSSIPGFMLGGIFLAYLVYQTLYARARTTLLPLNGFGLDEHLILPVIVLAARPLLQVAQVTASLLEYELQQDYIQVARSKGLSNFTLYARHAIPNVVSAIVMTIGQSWRLMVGSLLIVEAMFQWPGIGKAFTYALGLRLDGRSPWSFFASPPLIAALAVILGALLLSADLITTLTAHSIDPRLQFETSEVK